MSDLLYLPAALTYLLVALSINAGPRPAERWRLWHASLLAAGVAVLALDLDRWFGAAVWALLLAMHCEELGRAYRVELFPRA